MWKLCVFSISSGSREGEVYRRAGLRWRACWEHSVEHSTAKWTTMGTRRDTGVPHKKPVLLRVFLGSCQCVNIQCACLRSYMHRCRTCTCVCVRWLADIMVFSAMSCSSSLVLIHLHSSCTLAALVRTSPRTVTPANGHQASILKRGSAKTEPQGEAVV